MKCFPFLKGTLIDNLKQELPSYCNITSAKLNYYVSLRRNSLQSMAEISFSGEPSIRQLLPLERAESAVWNYFGFPTQGGWFIEKDKKKRTTVFCKLCLKQLPYHGSSTNMMAHLQYNHLSEFKKAKEKSDAVVPTAQRDSHLLLRPFNT